MEPRPDPQGPAPSPSMPPDPNRPPAPEGIQRSLRAFRARMRREKLTEAAAVCALAVSLSYLASAGLDRLVNTPAAVRGALDHVLAQ